MNYPRCATCMFWLRKSFASDKHAAFCASPKLYAREDKRRIDHAVIVSSDPREGADLYTFAQFGCVNHSTRPVFDLAGF
jgi:hypothetical protein